ncbi:MAG: hypothetical protein KA319_06775 [Ferruginibacter sp.]|nr:hypothetical protein [Ferruginibacter sp.]
MKKNYILLLVFVFCFLKNDLFAQTNCGCDTTSGGQGTYWAKSNSCTGWYSTNGNFDAIGSSYHWPITSPGPYYNMWEMDLHGNNISSGTNNYTNSAGLVRKGFRTVSGNNYSMSTNFAIGTPAVGYGAVYRAVDVATGTVLATINMEGKSGVQTLNFTAIGSTTEIQMGYITGNTTNTNWIAIPGPLRNTTNNTSVAAATSTSFTPGAIAATSSSICLGTSTSLSSSVPSGRTSPFGTLTWYSDSTLSTIVGTGSSLSVSPTSTKTYYAAIVSGTSCSKTYVSKTITVTNCAPLGIQSINFYGIKNSNSNAIIWKTAGEQNVAYFNLYKSTDAINYSLIAKINSKAIIGDNNKEYNYVDNKINDAINFYKLSSVDVDGKTTQYKIVKINNLSNTKNYTIYPTLVKKEVNVELRKYKKVTLQILSVEGKLLKSSLVTNISNQPVVKTTLNMCNYANGIYLIRIVDEIGGTISIEKIIKQ